MTVRKASSRRWLARQERDPYVARARARGYRSRAAFKLAELDDRFHVLAPGRAVVDLGAAPGGWSQVAAERVGPRGRVVAVDVLPLAPLRGVERLALDLADAGAEAALRAALPHGADAVLSDAAPAATGHRATDALRAAGLAEAAAELAGALLVPGGGFVVKVLRGGEGDLLRALRPRFQTVRTAKPPASRAGSAETYVVALGYAG